MKIIETANISDTLIAMELEKLNKLTELVEKRKTENNKYDFLISDLKQTQKTRPETRYGDELVYLKGDIDVVLHCPIEDYDLRTKKWNCIVVPDENSGSNSKVLKLKVKPDLFCVRGKYDHKWFVQLFLEYDGITYNREQIRTYSEMINENTIEILQKEKEIQELNSKFDAEKSKILEYKRKIDELTAKIEKIAFEYHNINNITNILNLLKEDGVSSLHLTDNNTNNTNNSQLE